MSPKTASESQRSSNSLVASSFPARKSASLPVEEARNLIINAGGIFIGKEELVQLGKLAPDVVLPEIPAKYSQPFLESKHPLRERTIASHLILAFDPESKQWHTMDRGEGGKSDIIPGSLGPDGLGLGKDQQDELLKKDGEQIKVAGVEISPHKDSFPIERILSNAVAQHLAAEKSIITAPLYNIWGRTADNQKMESVYRVLRSNANDFGVYVVESYHNGKARAEVGLIAGWN